MPGAVVRAFISEFYEITEEGRPVDDELSAILDRIPAEIRLLELSPAA